MHRAIFAVTLFVSLFCLSEFSLAQAPTAEFEANDTIICPGNTVSFTDLSTQGSNPIATWEWDFGDGNTDNIQNPSNTYTAGGNYTVQLIVSDGLGNADTITHIIYVMAATVPVHTVRICSPQSSTTVVANDPGIAGVTGNWFTASGAVIASPTNDTTLITNLVSGTYLFFWVVSDGICSDADQLTIIVDQPVTTNAGPDQTICSSPGTATMAASSPSPGTGQWTTTSSATIANPSSRTTAVSGMNVAGIYVFVWTVTNGSCVNRDTMQIVVSAVVTPNAGTDQQICSTTTTATLAANAAAPGTGLWTTTGSATITAPSNPASTVSNLIVGNNTFIWSITNGACLRRDTVLITVSQNVVATAGSDVQVCTSTASGTLTAANPSPGTGAWTAVSAGVITSPSSATTTVTGLNTAGTYSFVWTVTNGACVSRDTVQMIVRDPIAANAGVDQTLCAATTATLTGNNASPGTSLWNSLGAASVTSPSSATSGVTGLVVGNNSFQYTITYGACVTRDTVVVRVDALVTASAGPDQRICFATPTATMAANTPSSGSGLWTKLNGGTITTPSSPTTTITGLTPGTHSFVWTITNGSCVSRDTVSIIVDTQVPAVSGLDDEICQGSTAFLSANNPSPATGLWTTTSGATIVSPSNPNSSVTGLNNTGTYSFIWTVTNGACVLRDTMRITVDSSITANAGADQVVCVVSTATLTANAPAPGTGHWTTTGSATIASPNSATTNVSNLAYGINRFVYAITNGVCVSRDTVVVRRDSVITANAGPDQQICSSTGTATMAATSAAPGTGTWTALNGGTIVTASSPTTAITGLTTAGSYGFVWTVTNGSCTNRDTIQITVSQSVTANAGSDQALCNASSTNLAATAPVIGSGVWTTSSAAIIANSTSPTSGVSNLVVGSFQFIWTVTNGACNSRDTVLVRVDSLITSNAGPDQTLCSGATVTLAATAPSSGSGLWTALNGGTIGNASSASTNVSGLSAAGNYPFVWTVTNGSCISRDTVRITISATVTANAGTDQALCSVTTTNLAATAPVTGSGLWTTSSTAVITTPSSATSGVTNLAIGSYQFVWTVTNGACTSKDTVLVRIDSLVLSNAGPDQSVCAGTAVTLGATAPGAGTGTWTALNGGSFTNANAATSGVTGLSVAGNYQFVWTVTNGACVSRDTVVITITQLVAANAGADQTICNSSTATLAANNPSPGTGAWTSSSAASIASPSTASTAIGNLAVGTYTFVWTITNGTCVSRDTVQVRVDSLIPSNAGPDQTVCAGTNVTLAATSPSQGTAAWTALNGGTLSNASSATATVSGLTSGGNYQFVWTVTNGVCISRDTVVIIVNQFVAANAGSDQALCSVTSSILAANNPTPGSGVWTTTSAAQITSPNTATSAVSNLSAGTYQFVWTITNGACVSRDTMQIRIDSLISADAGVDQSLCVGEPVSLTAALPSQGSGIWTALNGGTIVSPTSATSAVTGLSAAGNYSFVWTVTNGTCTDKDTVVVVINAVVQANAGPDQFLCDDISTLLAGNDPLTATGIWTTNSSATIDSPTDFNTLVEDLSPGDFTFVWTVTNGTCVSTDTVVIHVDALIKAIAGPAQQICSGSDVVLAANDPTPGSGAWTSPDGGTFLDANDPNTTLSGLTASGVHYVYWTITNGSCTSVDSVEITVDSLVQADAGADQNLCENTTTAQLAGNVVSPGIVSWSTGSTAVIADPSDPNTAISNLTPGTFEFIYTITNQTCVSTDTVIIQVDSLIAANAGADQQICSGGQVSLSGNTPASGFGLWLSPSGGVFSDPTDPATSLAGLVQAGVYPVTWTVTNGACVSTDTLLIQVDSLVTADAGPDQSLCETTNTTTLAANAVTVGAGTWTTSSTAVISDPNDPATTVSGLVIGSFDFVWTVVNGNCTSSDTVTITVSQQVNPADAGSDQQVCANATGLLLNAQVPGIGTGVWTTTGGATIVDPSDAASAIDNLDAGINTFIWTVSNGACVSSDTVVVITTPVPVADAGPDQFTTSGTPVTIGGTPASTSGTGPVAYLWSPAAYLTDSSAANPTATVLVTQEFVLIATDSLGCSTTDTMVVYVNDPPVAVDDSLTINEDSVVAVVVLNNDTDPDNNINPGSVQVGPGPYHGTASVDPLTGVITYTPTANYFGLDSLYYVVCDSGVPVYCDSAWVYFNILPVNDAPIANDDTISTDKDSCVLIGVLSNDTDVENGIVVSSLVVLSGPLHGTIVTDTLLGTIYYCPDSAFIGNDTLTYAICDSGMPVLCDTAVVIITVNPANYAPMALNDSVFACSADSSVVNLLANDSDPDGDSLTVTLITLPAHGTATLDSLQQLIYLPDSSYSGLDSVQYQICDGGTPDLCDTAWVIINNHVSPALSVQITPVACYGDSTGALDVTVVGSGPFTYTWTTSDTVQDLTHLIAGIYSVLVIDSVGCTRTASYTVSEPAAALSALISMQPVLCHGDSSGAIDLQVSGGTSPYTYLWSNGSTDEDPDSLTAGIYAVTVTDSLGCTVVLQDTLVQPDSALSAILSVTDIVCSGDSTGAISVVVGGGTPSYTYAWSNSDTTASISALQAGVYTLIITDAFNCQLTVSDTVQSLNSPILSNEVLTNPRCLESIDGSITLNPSGGAGNYSYQWSIGDTTALIDSLSAGIYDVTISDSLGCSADFSIVLADSSDMNISISGALQFCNGDSAVLTVPTYTGVAYQWYNGGVALTQDTLPSLVVLQSGDYTLVAIAPCANFQTDTIHIVANAAPSIVVTDSAVINCDSALTLVASGGLQYSWTPAVNCETPAAAQTVVHIDESTVFYVVVTDVNGCSATDSVPVTVNCLPIFVPSGFSPNNDGFNDKFVISNIQQYPDAVLKVFNRWGDLVYKQAHYDNSFAGNSNVGLSLGDRLPEGTYYYVLEPGAGKASSSGYIVLRR